MLLEACEAFDVPASDAVFVGDRAVDAQAARATGMPFVWAREFFDRP